jgi:hypothetical protein
MGDEVFWNTMNREFSDERWLVRFKTGLENFVQLGKFVQKYSIFNTKKVRKFNEVSLDEVGGPLKFNFSLDLVDRVLVLAHLVPAITVKSSRLLQTSLSCAFSHLIVSANDPNNAVAQKAILALRALPPLSLTVIR